MSPPERAEQHVELPSRSRSRTRTVGGRKNVVPSSPDRQVLPLRAMSSLTCLNRIGLHERQPSRGRRVPVHVLPAGSLGRSRSRAQRSRRASGYGDCDEPLDWIFDRRREFLQGMLHAAGHLRGLEQVEGRDVALLDLLHRLFPRDRRPLRMAHEEGRGEARRPRAARSTHRHREACTVDLLESTGSTGSSQNVPEVRRVELTTMSRPSAPHLAQLAKRHRPVDEMADEPQDGALEPAVAKRQVFCPARLQPDRGGDVAGGHPQHLRLGIQPQTWEAGLRERLAETSRAAAAVEHTPSRRSPSSTTSSSTSRELSSMGRTRSYSPASRPKSGVVMGRLAPGDAPAVELERPHLRDPPPRLDNFRHVPVVRSSQRQPASRSSECVSMITCGLRSASSRCAPRSAATSFPSTSTFTMSGRSRRDRK